MHNKMIRKTAVALILVLGIVLVSGADAEILLLGDNGEFAIDTMVGYTYYTPNSDLTAVATTAGYMFKNFDQYVCYVVGNKQTALIAYYPTTGNSDLLAADKIQLSMDLEYAKDAPFFIKPFIVIPWSSAYEFYQSDELSENATVYYSTFFVFLEKGVVVIAANSTNDRSITDFTSNLYDSIRVSKTNGFVD